MNSVVVSLLLLFGISCAIPAPPSEIDIRAQLRKDRLCCPTLKHFLPNKVHFDDILDLEYQKSQKSYWSAQEQGLRPTCIVLPTSSKDVSTAVTILNAGYQAKIKGCNFAIRSAGHTPQPGAANIDGGVTIDLQSMNQVIISNDQRKVSIGPGNRWGNVYPKLDELNLAMLGGRLSPVGAGGLITGGGISFFSPRYGFACDNVEEFEVVLANGTIVTASQSTKSDLYRALKGGSSNFGIVTRIDATLRPQEAFWGGSLAQPITNKDAVFEFISKLTVSETYDPYVALIVAIGWAAGIPVMVHNIAYTNGEVDWPPPAYATLVEMPKVASTIRKAKLASFTDEAGTSANVTNGRNNMFHSLTIINDPVNGAHFLSQVYALSDETAKELLLVTGLIFSLSIQPMPHILYSKSGNTGGNVLGLDRFEDDLINLLYTLSWQITTDNAIVDAAMQKLENKIVELAKSEGVFNEFVYLNYGAHWQDPIQGYGTANVEFLAGVSRKYDSNGLFQKGVPGGFKLGL